MVAIMSELDNLEQNRHLERLARFGYRVGADREAPDSLPLVEALVDAIESHCEDPDYPDSRVALGLPAAEDVTLDDLHAGLRLLPNFHDYIDHLERQLIEAALDQGATLTSLAELYDMTRQGLAKRYRALGGHRELLPGRPHPTTW
jgi:hypothetical protein